ncbi:MAG: hypothetical protein GF400_04625 [Candidatus Eisenbacteria bacterium]|nr:hypothetical protein [Candidatus Eisenbacteria bacterium]
MRPVAIALAVCLLLCASAAFANPLVLWWLRDSPLDAPNGVWDDQWSGGLVLPEGEIAYIEDPGYDPDCFEFESENSFVHLGTGGEVLRAYLDPPIDGTQVGGPATARLSFRQTTPEIEFVYVNLYKVGLFGEDPELIGGDSATVEAIPAWPPTTYDFVLGNVPQMEMQDERFMVTVFCDGQYTDLVWDCTGWDGWIQLPQEDPFNPVEAMNWSTIKAMYR